MKLFSHRDKIKIDTSLSRLYQNKNLKASYTFAQAALV